MMHPMPQLLLVRTKEKRGLYDFICCRTDFNCCRTVDILNPALTFAPHFDCVVGSLVGVGLVDCLCCVETVQYFITTMDALRIEQRYVDELQPLLSDLMDSLTRLPQTPNDFEPNRKVQQWLRKLNGLRAVDQIEEADARQMLYDLDSAYTEFTRYLKSQSGSS